MLCSLLLVGLIYYTSGFLINNTNINDIYHGKVATTCIVSAIKDIYEPPVLTILTNDELDSPGFEIRDSLMSVLIHPSKWSVEVTNGMKNNHQEANRIIENFNYFLILTDSIEAIKEHILKLKSLPSFRLDGRYLVYFFKITKYYKKVIQDIFLAFYRMNIYKVTILIPISQYEFKLFGYDLYKNSRVCADNPIIINLNTCINGTYLKKVFYIEYDFQRLNCSINAIVMRRPPFIVDKNTGFEVNLLKEITIEMNITFNMDKVMKDSKDWGQKVNESWNGLLGLLQNKPFTIGIGNVFLTEDRRIDFDYTHFYYHDKIIWVVPAALEIPKWKSSLHAFSLHLWLSLLAVLIIFGSCFYCGSKYSESEYNIFKHLGAGFILSFQIFLGQPTYTQPKSKVLRILFIHLASFCIVIVCFFQCSLIGFMSNPTYEEEINSEKAVFNSGLGIGGLKAYKGIFHNPNDERLMKIYNRYETYQQTNDTLALWLLTVAQDRDTITILNEAYVKYLIAIRKSEIVRFDGTPKVFMVPDVIYTLPVGIIFCKGFPLKDAFDHIIRGLIQAGFIEKWRNEIFTKHNIPKDLQQRLMNKSRAGTQEILNVLSFRDMSGAFVFLIVGYSISIFGFIFEHFQFKIEQMLEYQKKSNVNNRRALIISR